MKKFLILFLLLFPPLIVFNSIAFAETQNIEEEAPVYYFPEIKPEFYGFAGYRLIDHSGSVFAGEFEYLHSSFAGGIQFIAFPFPHRIHLGVDILNPKDFFGDARYAYKDIVLFRGVTRKVFHNLENVTLVDLDLSSSLFNIETRDPGKEYGIEKSISNVFLRFKMPDFPLHLYFGGNFVDKNGTQQERFLASYTPINRVSAKRKIDWNSSEFIIGTNSHIGHVEMDLSHSEKRLNVNDAEKLESNYNGNVFPHNLMPESKGSTTTLKLHTSYTGRLVAAATFSWMDRENNESSAKANYFLGAGEVTYMPRTDMTFFVKYRHKKTDMDNPDEIPENYLGYPAYISPIEVRPSISSSVDAFSGTVRYRPINRLTLNAEYIYERTERENSDEWKIASITVRNALSLYANTRITEKLNLKVKYTHQEIDAPAYNVQPETSDEGKVSVLWTPINWITSLLSYSIAKENRDEIYYIDEGVQVTAENRMVQRNRLLGSVTFVAYKNLSITPSYAYVRNKIKQDLLYDNIGVNPQYYRDSDVLYNDTANTYAVNLNYIPEKNLSLNFDVSHTESKGDFSPNGPVLSLTSFAGTEAEAKVRETNYGIRGDYEFKNGWGLGIKYNYMDYNDLFNDFNDGNIYVVLMTISKKW